ncbi:MAG: hypothetical protein CL910_01910 [Deltaproteobacteria bacterium]|nr:hypothetical protein [Deltaproteobacteria bacterium]
MGRARLVLLGLLGALVALLVVGENPWTAGVAQALERGSSPKSVDFWASHGFAFAAVDAALLVLLIALAGRWVGPRRVPFVSRLAPGPLRGIGVLLVLGAMLVGGSLAAPRLSFSLWDDEIYNVYRSIHGGWGFDE